MKNTIDLLEKPEPSDDFKIREKSGDLMGITIRSEKTEIFAIVYEIIVNVPFIWKLFTPNGLTLKVNTWEKWTEGRKMTAFCYIWSKFTNFQPFCLVGNVYKWCWGEERGCLEPKNDQRFSFTANIWQRFS